MLQLFVARRLGFQSSAILPNSLYIQQFIWMTVILHLLPFLSIALPMSSQSSLFFPDQILWSLVRELVVIR